MIQHWAPVVASAMGILYVLFITTSDTMATNMFHLYLKQDVAFPFESIEIEGKYVDNLSSLTSKRVVSVGPLVVDSVDVDSEQNNVIQWLDTKTTISTVFVSLGSDVPIIAIPMHLDESVKAWFVVEIEMGKEVEKNNKGVLMGLR
uniref:Uncharacterized protein n=1 Tax=Tanacetum cinerariifolium TaxID=118510 RepID=A0A6L2JC41_TANCI|nr:hypothetical protein [Tanacetum cinerariifolium]